MIDRRFTKFKLKEKMPKKDVSSAIDIKFIMHVFYKKLLADEHLSPFFTHVTHVADHLEEHLNLLTTFWSQSLFQTGGYYNNMFYIHKNVHEQMPFEEKHYKLWLDHFFKSIDENYRGENAERMKNQSLSMATIMKVKGLSS